jgi:hypothetical protein
MIQEMNTHPRDGIRKIKFDGFVKSPSAALRCILRRCGVPVSTPHSSGLARLASGAFYITIQILAFYESIKFNPSQIIAQDSMHTLKR